MRPNSLSKIRLNFLEGRFTLGQNKLSVFSVAVMCGVRETLQFCSRTVSFDLVVFRSLLARVSDQFFVSSPHEESDNNGEKKLFKDSSSKLLL